MRNLKETNAALEDKNRQLNLRLEKLMREATGVSVMDFKINFSRQDIELGRGRLVEELLELRQAEQGQAIKVGGGSHADRANQQTTTEMRNITKDIVYRNEHGAGVLAHGETQTETEPLKQYARAETQTEEVKVFELDDPFLLEKVREETKRSN